MSTISNDWADTVPLDDTPAESLAEYILGTTIVGRGRCVSGPCRQGRGICPTPVACRVVADLDDEDSSVQRPSFLRREGAGTVFWPFVMVLAVLGGAAAWHLLARIFN